MNKMKRLIGIVLLLVLAQIACATATQSPAGGASQTKSVTPTTAASGVAPTTLTVKDDPHLGPILADQKGWTLYTYQQDQPGVSNCDATCAQSWPPLTLSGDTPPTAASQLPGKVGLIRRADGGVQVTYNQLPLYRYAGDLTAQDTRGQGIDGAWDVVAAR